METYIVLTAIERGTNDKNHKRFEAGSTIDLDYEAAAPLLAVQAISEAPKTDSAKANNLDDETAAPLPAVQAVGKAPKADSAKAKK